MKKNNIPTIENPKKNFQKFGIKNMPSHIEKELKNKKIKMVALVAPSFVVSFEYPQFIHQLRDLGFDKVVELTFGAKMINREYHEQLSLKKKGRRETLLISTTCPGITAIVKEKYPQYVKNLILIDSPMIAMAKICKKVYPKHKTCFISPCNYKKIEAENSKHIDYVIDYEQLGVLFNKNGIKSNKNHIHFDKFYNDYTKIYPLSGGLSKTAHLKGVLKKGEEKTIDGIGDVMRFLSSPDKKVRFLDCTFCMGGCLGGPHTSKLPIKEKTKKLMKYMAIAKKEDIPIGREGIIEKAKGISFKL
jgi:ferredoxin hydrogenase